MPRKHIRKVLPDARGIREHRLVARFDRVLDHSNLWHLNRHSVAGAVAIGMFAGLVPGPLQMLTALLLAIALRRNLPVALLTTLYTNPFTIVPLYALAYGYGALLTGSAPGLPGAVTPFEMQWTDLAASLRALVAWAMALGTPLFVGLPALALTLAALGYTFVQIGWRVYVRLAWRARARRRTLGR